MNEKNFEVGKCYQIRNRKFVCLFDSNKDVVSLKNAKPFYFVFLGLIVIACGAKDDHLAKMKLLHDSKIYYLHSGWFKTIEEICTPNN